MPGNRNFARLALSWLWVIVVSLYMFWGYANETGLYGWLVDLQVRQWGSYSSKLTVVLPILLLGAPAWIVLRRRAQEVDADYEARGPAAKAGRARRVALTMLAFGLVSSLVGAGAYLLSQNVPDGSEPPRPFDAAAWTSGPPPADRVTIRGEVDPEAGVTMTEQGFGANDAYAYVGFRPEGFTDKNAPHRIFVRRRTGNASDPTVSQMFLPDQEGYLREKALPELARRDLEARGVRIAEPYYVLESAGAAPRDTYYVVAALGGMIGFICLLVGLIGLFQARRMEPAPSI